MSKQIKQMEMGALKATFQEVRDLVVLSPSGLSAQADNQLRTALRKKNIRVQVVKNSLARRIFEDMGIQGAFWEGPTALAWGAGSLAELSRELDGLLRKNDKVKAAVKIKTAIAEGQPVPFPQALTMPTRAEAIARVVGLVLSPAARVVSQVMGPASQVMGQIKTLAERAPAGEPAPAGGEAAAPAATS